MILRYCRESAFTSKAALMDTRTRKIQEDPSLRVQPLWDPSLQKQILPYTAQEHGCSAPGQHIGMTDERRTLLSKQLDLLVERIRPSFSSDNRRTRIAQYIEGLVKACFPFPTYEVTAFVYGSVPLKTYLPDGDIDMAIFQKRGQSIKECWAASLEQLLKTEAIRADLPFRIRDVHVVNAEVRLLKCEVDGIVVDISFNSVNGLCTLGFLEEMDRWIGSGHLFKRSVILVKAWCYYESRLLGSHHTLISTYALETMILYIFNYYYRDIKTPYDVLSYFLDVFGDFDWDSNCLTLHGGVPIKAIVLGQATVPLTPVGVPALLQSDVLASIVERYRDTSPHPSGRPHEFQPRYFNVLDPLQKLNNLSRGVTRGSKQRIKRALITGAAKLRAIREAQTEEAVVTSLEAFFRNTRHSRSKAADPPTSQPLTPTLTSTSATPLGSPSPGTETWVEEARKVPGEGSTVEGSVSEPYSSGKSTPPGGLADQPASGRSRSSTEDGGFKENSPERSWGRDGAHPLQGTDTQGTRSQGGASGLESDRGQGGEGPEGPIGATGRETAVPQLLPDALEPELLLQSLPHVAKPQPPSYPPPLQTLPVQVQGSTLPVTHGNGVLPPGVMPHVNGYTAGVLPPAMQGNPLLAGLPTHGVPTQALSLLSLQGHPLGAGPQLPSRAMQWDPQREAYGAGAYGEEAERSFAQQQQRAPEEDLLEGNLAVLECQLELAKECQEQVPKRLVGQVPLSLAGVQLRGPAPPPQERPQGAALPQGTSLQSLAVYAQQQMYVQQQQQQAQQAHIQRQAQHQQHLQQQQRERDRKRERERHQQQAYEPVLLRALPERRSGHFTSRNTSHDRQRLPHRSPSVDSLTVNRSHFQDPPAPIPYGMGTHAVPLGGASALADAQQSGEFSSEASWQEGLRVQPMESGFASQYSNGEVSFARRGGGVGGHGQGLGHHSQAANVQYNKRQQEQAAAFAQQQGPSLSSWNALQDKGHSWLAEEGSTALTASSAAHFGVEGLEKGLVPSSAAPHTASKPLSPPAVARSRRQAPPEGVVAEAQSGGTGVPGHSSTKSRAPKDTAPYQLTSGEDFPVLGAAPAPKKPEKASPSTGTLPALQTGRRRGFSDGNEPAVGKERGKERPAQPGSATAASSSHWGQGTTSDTPAATTVTDNGQGEADGSQAMRSTGSLPAGTVAPGGLRGLGPQVGGRGGPFPVRTGWQSVPQVSRASSLTGGSPR